MLDLCLLGRESLNELPLLFKICVSYQLRVVHLNQLKLLRSRKFLLDKTVTFPSVCLLYFVDLSQETLLIFSSLSSASLFDFIIEFMDDLCMV